MPGTLVLNATYEPLCVVPLRRAVVLVLAEKATVLQAGDGQMRSVSAQVPIPSVIRLIRYVRVPYRRRAALTRQAVLARDDYTCQYCGGHATTIDHVTPRARGGLHRWENVVGACSDCNSAKADRLLTELGWKLARKPAAPEATTGLVLAIARRDPAWEPYLASLGISAASFAPA